VHIIQDTMNGNVLDDVEDNEIVSIETCQYV
jgi:hypothetical protein